MAYLRSLSCMIEHHTGTDLVKRTNILHNREVRERVFISDADFRIVYEAADPMQRVILCLGAYMGLRRIEMQSIRDGDIDRGILTIHGKGHGQEGLMAYMPIPAPVMAAIDEYRASPMKAGPRADDYLIQTPGRDGRLHRIIPSRVSDAVTRLGRETGVRITTHSLRRYFATTLYYSAGTDIQTVRRLLRHADVSTTLKCYVEAYDEKANRASEKLTRHIGTVVDRERKVRRRGRRAQARRDRRLRFRPLRMPMSSGRFVPTRPSSSSRPEGSPSALAMAVSRRPASVP